MLNESFEWMLSESSFEWMLSESWSCKSVLSEWSSGSVLSQLWSSESLLLSESSLFWTNTLSQHDHLNECSQYDLLNSESWSFLFWRLEIVIKSNWMCEFFFLRIVLLNETLNCRNFLIQQVHVYTSHLHELFLAWKSTTVQIHSYKHYNGTLIFIKHNL